MSEPFVLYLDNDKVIQKDIETPNDKGEPVAATDLVGVTFSIAATKGGVFISGLANLPLTERAEMPGRYFVVLDGETLRTALVTYVDKTVWGCLALPGNLRIWDEYIVRGFRP